MVPNGGSCHYILLCTSSFKHTPFARLQMSLFKQCSPLKLSMYVREDTCAHWLCSFRVQWHRTCVSAYFYGKHWHPGLKLLIANTVKKSMADSEAPYRRYPQNPPFPLFPFNCSLSFTKGDRRLWLHLWQFRYRWATSIARLAIHTGLQDSPRMQERNLSV